MGYTEIVGKEVKLKFSASHISRSQKVADRHGITRAEAMRQALDIGLDCIQAYGEAYISDISYVRQRVTVAVKNDVSPTLFKLSEKE